MDICDAFCLINNLDYEKGLKRKFGPKYSLMQLDKRGDIVAVYRFKNSPTEKQQLDALKSHSGTIQIPAMVGMFNTMEELEIRVEKSMSLFSKMH